MSSRRNFVKQTAALGAGIALAPQLTFGSSSIKKNTKYWLNWCWPPRNQSFKITYY